QAQENARDAAAKAPAAGLAGWTESHGLSTFGELALPADFKHFAYVNPKAPKGGKLSFQVTTGGANVDLETFDTFNTFILRGSGAAGMGATFDTLMTGNGDEPSSMYGLVARKVRISDDRLTYRFFLRPEARFHDGSKLTAEDAAFTFNLLKREGHPLFKIILRDFIKADAASASELVVLFDRNRARDTHLTIAGLPIFSKKYWDGRDFQKPTLDEPLGSGAYKLGKYEQGRYIEFNRVRDYWANDLPVNVGANNFDIVRYEYFRERQIAFEAFKSGTMNYREEFTSRTWHTSYTFPAIREGRVKREEIPDGKAVPSQGWYFNTRRKQFKDPRVREAIALAFDFEWTNRNIMFNTYKRTHSFFENTPMKAVGKPGPEELKLLEKWRGKVPQEVFGEPWAPPASDGSGSDRNLLRKANALLMAAGCKRQGRQLLLPDGSPFEMQFLDSGGALTPHTQPFQANLKKLGIASSIRIVDAAQYKRRLDNFDFDIMIMAMGGSHTPGDSLRYVYSSVAAKTKGSRNMAGIAEPAIDEMLERVARASTREELTVAVRVLDRLLRAGRYWVPMWYKSGDFIAYWDVFSRPEKQPKFGTGAPDTWWWDEAKADKIGLGRENTGTKKAG
ncbi:MAG: ABC transporter substrate-binding protein, partial [Hyphomicrobiales bacterium]|nr:ABC transporter substrate-binding protein [Hyphomicrobiales bacterium]